eukprot:g2174.t1
MDVEGAVDVATDGDSDPMLEDEEEAEPMSLAEAVAMAEAKAKAEAEAEAEAWARAQQIDAVAAVQSTGHHADVVKSPEGALTTLKSAQPATVVSKEPGRRKGKQHARGAENTVDDFHTANVDDLDVRAKIRAGAKAKAKAKADAKAKMKAKARAKAKAKGKKKRKKGKAQESDDIDGMATDGGKNSDVDIDLSGAAVVGNAIKPTRDWRAEAADTLAKTDFSCDSARLGTPTSSDSKGTRSMGGEVEVDKNVARIVRADAFEAGDDDGGLWCSTCNRHNVMCALCQLPVLGAALYNLACGHGGHFDCMRNWFELNHHCPSCGANNAAL